MSTFLSTPPEHRPLRRPAPPSVTSPAPESFPSRSPRPMKRPFPFLPVLAAVLAVGFAAGGCGLLESDRLGDQTRLLEQAEIRWAIHGPDEYRMVYQRGCFCGGDVTRAVELQVTPEGVQERRFADSGEPVPDELAHLYLSVPEIFAEVRKAIRDRVHWLHAEYHPDLGYPVQVSIDPLREVADDETAHQVLELVPSP